MKNIKKAYEVCLSPKPRDEKFKQLLNLGIWEAKVALNRFLTEKGYDTLNQSEKEIMERLINEGVPEHL
jgi:hypothetical protein